MNSNATVVPTIQDVTCDATALGPSTPSLLPASTRRKLNCYLLLLPTALLVGLFCYYPAISSVYYSLFDWDGAARSDFTGLSNYFEAFRDPNLIWGFAVILILIAANVVKMIPSIAIALAIFHLRRS